MDVLGFHHLAVGVYHLEQLSSFYSQVLGLSEMARHHRQDGSLRSIWMVIPQGGFLALEQVDEGVFPERRELQRPGPFLIALRIASRDRASVLQRLAEKGIALEHETRWTLYFRDPEGNRVALSHHPEDPPVNS